MYKLRAVLNQTWLLIYSVNKKQQSEPNTKLYIMPILRVSRKSSILPLPSLIKYFQLQFMLQFSYNYLPTSFHQTWIKNYERFTVHDTLELTNDDNFYVPFSGLSSATARKIYGSVHLQSYKL
jgi:hypothetical protein